MINTYSKNDNNIRGAATLIMTVIMLTVATLIIIFSANYSKMQTASSANMTRNEEAFAAAEAGLEFGINYLKENYSTIIANPVGGYIPIYTNAAITNVVMANNATFTVVYTNPVASEYKIIEITSTGTSADGTAVRTVSQQVRSGSILLNLPTSTLSVSGNISLAGNTRVYNIESDDSLQTGGSVEFSGNASTITPGGGSDKTHISSDIQENAPEMQGSGNETFDDFFGTDSLLLIKSKFIYQYTNDGSTNFSSTLDGKTGTSIWIEQTVGSDATLSGNVTLGTTASPVLVVVNNGTLTLSGNVQFSGFIFTLGNSGLIDIRGNANTSGGIVGTGDLTASGSASLNYSSEVLANLQNLSSMSYFAKIPGTWRDY